MQRVYLLPHLIVHVRHRPLHLHAPQRRLAHRDRADDVLPAPAADEHALADELRADADRGEARLERGELELADERGVREALRGARAEDARARGARGERGARGGGGGQGGLERGDGGGGGGDDAAGDEADFVVLELRARR